jgi:hypothetical protein
MAIDKAVNQAPTGLPALMEEGGMPGIEIEIENPEGVTIGMDGLEIEIEPEKEESDFSANLAEEMDEKELTSLVGDLLGDYESDVSSRKDWVQTYVDGA